MTLPFLFTTPYRLELKPRSRPRAGQAGIPLQAGRGRSGHIFLKAVSQASTV
jgi:hypothetical protein